MEIISIICVGFKKANSKLILEKYVLLKIIMLSHEQEAETLLTLFLKRNLCSICQIRLNSLIQPNVNIQLHG